MFLVKFTNRKNHYLKVKRPRRNHIFEFKCRVSIPHQHGSSGDPHTWTLHPRISAEIACTWWNLYAALPSKAGTRGVRVPDLYYIGRIATRRAMSLRTIKRLFKPFDVQFRVPRSHRMKQRPKSAILWLLSGPWQYGASRKKGVK